MSGQIRYVNWKEGTNVRLSTTHLNGPPRAAAFIHGNELFATADNQGSLKLWAT